MTDADKNQIREMASKAPRSVWGYWPFIFPVLLVLFGIAIQVALLTYFEQRVRALEVCLRLGTKVVTLWDSQLVKEAILTVSLSITLTFALLAVLARRAHRQVALLKLAAAELGIDLGQKSGAPNGSQPAGSGARLSSSAGGPPRSA